MCNHNLLPNPSSPLAITTHTHSHNTNTATTLSHKPILLQPSQSYAYTQNPANITNATTILNNSTHHNSTHTNTTTNNNNTNKSSIYEAPQTFFSLLGQYLTTSLHREVNDYGSFKTTTTPEEAEKGEERLRFRIQVSMT